VRNGSRAAELNMPAAIYAETHGSTGIGGADDHAGVDIGRTFTEAPAAATPEEFLQHLRTGRAEAGREQGSAAKWATRQWPSPPAPHPDSEASGAPWHGWHKAHWNGRSGCGDEDCAAGAG
jgi:hypothetical protein